MVRLFEVVVIENPKSEEDWMYAQRLAIKCLEEDEKPVGYPGFMWTGIKESAGNFLDDGEWAHYLYLCLMLVQKRYNGMDNLEVAARAELERIFMDFLFT